MVAAYGLTSLDAIHLASAVHVGAGVFVTNTRNDFTAHAIKEIRVVNARDLAGAA